MSKKTDALAWLEKQGTKATKNKNKKDLDNITYLIKELSKPDHLKYLEQLRKIVAAKGTLSISEYLKIVPKNTTKTINQKTNKRT